MIIVVALLAVNFGGNSFASVFFAKTDRKLPIYSVETDDKKVGISFDAAWGADKTDGILAILNEYDVKATFFLVGFWVEEYPDKVKAIKEAGHEIGTHSNTHPDMSLLSEADMKEELESSMHKIKNVTGESVKLFRPPFGAYCDNLIYTADSLGLTTIQWDTDSLDWKGYSGTDIAKRVLTRVKCGSIILMHNNSDNILQGLRLTLEGLKQKGYEVTNIGNLIYKTNYSINNQGVQQPI